MAVVTWGLVGTLWAADANPHILTLHPHASYKSPTFWSGGVGFWGSGFGACRAVTIGTGASIRNTPHKFNIFWYSADSLAWSGAGIALEQKSSFENPSALGSWRLCLGGVSLPGKGNSNAHGGARPVNLITTMIKWIRTSRLSIRKSLIGAPRQSVCPCTTEGWRDRERERDRQRERETESQSGRGQEKAWSACFLSVRMVWWPFAVSLSAYSVI